MMEMPLDGDKYDSLLIFTVTGSYHETFRMALYGPLLSRDTLAGHSGGHPTGLVELAVRVS